MGRRIIALLMALLLAMIAQSAAAVESAPDEESDGPSEVWVSGNRGQVGTNHVVSCSFDTGDVLRFYYAETLEATGWLTGCIPNDPDVCRVETDIEIWNTIDRRWNLYKDGPNVYPSPCGGGKSHVVAKGCEPSSKGYNYRARTWVTIVEDGYTDTDIDTGPTRQYYCL